MAVNPGALYEYCNKPDSRVEGGRSDRSAASPAGEDRGAAGGISGAVRKRGLGEVYEFIKSGKSWDDVVNEFPVLYASKEVECRKLYERFGRGKLVSHGREQPECIIIWGPPGTGKSTFAKRIFVERGIEYFRMTIGKWADGYAYEEGLFIDDMEPNLMPRAQLLLLMETGSVRWEVKGSTTAINVKTIVITSNFNPVEWFPRHEKNAEEMRERGLAVIRRAEVYSQDNGSWIRSAGNTIPADSVKKLEESQSTLLKLWKTKEVSVPPVAAASSSCDAGPSILSSSSSSYAGVVPAQISRKGYEQMYRAAMDRLEKESKDPSVDYPTITLSEAILEQMD